MRLKGPADTGNEDKNAVVLIDAASCAAWLFLPPQTEREASRDGWNWLYQEGADTRWGFEKIYPQHYLDEFMARRRVGGQQRLYVRLSERDLIDQSRTDAALFFARRLSNPWGGQPSEDSWRIEQLRSRYPYYELSDVTPQLDELRMHKTPREIEAQRMTGRVSAAAIARARTREIAQEIFARHGFGEGHYPGGAGHFVGMAVHDVGDYSRPLEAGMVIAVEPIIEIPEHHLHIRIEDTVLITEDGAENLSISVPRELEDIEALVGSEN